ncbi:MAGE-like proteiny domain [Sesbania bispinosa]|nr:MAGE-like proteiny domain [Sesbania bispinosa]
MANGIEDFSQFGISKEEKDKLVGEVIRHMLFKTHQNSGCPIKRDELTQLVTKNYHQRNLPTFVINEAKDKLSTVFGYEMKELKRSLPSSKTQTQLSQQSAADSKSYILISQLPPDVYEKYVVDVKTTHLSGFTFAIISIVYLAGGKIPEESLWSQMRRMGLSENEASHPVLGNIKQALELLVQQRFLQKDKVSGPEGTTTYFELAERARDGPISDKVKEYISQIVKDNISVGAA